MVATTVAAETMWRSLSGAVRGRVFRPGEAGYRTHSRLFNRRYDGRRRPLAVLVAADTADVRNAVLWARENDIPVVARSAGHSFAGYSVNDGLVIDLSRLSRVTADESTGLVTMGGGTRAGQMYDAVRPYEMVVPAGTNPIVGMAGLALGGGCEFASRRFGLTADAMVETTLVTADGQVVTCNANDHPDLFWACRGGGGGNFGINVSFTFQASPVSDVATFDLTWRRADAVRVLDTMQHLVADAPDTFSARLGVSTSGRNATEARDNVVVSTVGQLFGTARELREILDPVLTVAVPVSQEILDRTYWGAKGTLVHATEADAFAMRTRYVTTPITVEGLETLLSFVDRWPGSGSGDGGGFGLFSWGGAINRVPPDATAFVHRDTLFLLSMDTAWADDDPSELVDANLRWLDDLYEAMAPYASSSSYQNFSDPSLEDWPRAYYGANYPRLAEIKRRYDPDNFFRFEQSIRPAPPRPRAGLDG